MMRFARRLRYRDRVMEQLSTLLVMYPRGRQLAKDFPALPATIRTRFDEGVSPASCAVELAGAILCGLLGQLDAEQRTAVAARMRGTSAEEFRSLASRRIVERRRDVLERVTFAANLAGVALFLARRMVQEGNLGIREYEFLGAEVDRGLAGLGPRHPDARSEGAHVAAASEH